MLIQLMWEGPYSLSDLDKLNNTDKDYGIYQVYGTHPVYGQNKLLYIGKAAMQTFGKRISQENWIDTNNYKNNRIYVGRVTGSGTPPCLKTWHKQISIAESLLIHTHRPAYNAMSLNLTHTIDDVSKNIHIMNWGDHCDLLPEVSGLRWSSLLDDDNLKSYRKCDIHKKD